MINYRIEGSIVRIQTDSLSAAVRTEGYVSGVMAGSFVDKELVLRIWASDLSLWISCSNLGVTRKKIATYCRIYVTSVAISFTDRPVNAI